MENWLNPTDLNALIQVIFVNVVLSGDNAVIVGMAAAGLEPKLRNKAIIAGIVAATVLRIVFSLVAVQMLEIVGLLFLGGALLAWVAWKMWCELREAHLEQDANHSGESHQIIVADVSMSLDNILAVVGIARTNLTMLVVGLVMSIVLMAVASSLIAALLARYRWISYIGLALIVFVAVKMMWDGGLDVAHHFGWVAAA